GTIRSTESLALSILRLMEEEAIKENTSQIEAIVPVDVAAFLLNEKRKAIRITEQRHDVEVYVIPDSHMMTPDYRVIRHRNDDEITESSYKRIEQPEAKLYEPRKLERTAAPVPALKGFAAPQKVEQAPTPTVKEPSPQPGFFSKLISAISALFSSAEKPASSASTQTATADATNAHRRNRRNDPRRARSGQDAEKAKDGNREPRNRNNKKVAETTTQERPVREKEDSVKRPAKTEAKPRVQAPKEAVAEVQDDAPKQEVARERRQRRNMRRKVRIDNTESATEPQLQEEAILAQVAAVNASVTTAAPVTTEATVMAETTSAVAANPTDAAQVTAETKAPRPRRQPRKDNAPAAEHAEVSVNNATADTTIAPVVSQEAFVPAAGATVKELTADSTEIALDTAASESVELTDADDKAKRDSRDGQRRSRRSPRHLRAAGQRRRRDEDEQGTSAPAQFIPNDELGADEQYPSAIIAEPMVPTSKAPAAHTEPLAEEAAAPATLAADAEQPPRVTNVSNVIAEPQKIVAPEVIPAAPQESTVSAETAETIVAVTDSPNSTADNGKVTVPTTTSPEATKAKATVVETVTEIKITPAVIEAPVAVAPTDDLKVKETAKDPVKAIASAPMTKPAAIVKPAAQVQTTATPVSTSAAEPVKSKPQAASRFGAMVSSQMTKPAVEVRAQVEVPKGREYDNAATDEASAAKIKLTNSAGSDMARP
ncbi:MAG: ribonuclease E, partial [Shewanella sp.]